MEKKLTISGILHSLTETSFLLLNNLFALAKTEGKLASQSFFSLIIMAIFLCSLLMATWLMLMGMGLTLLLNAHFSWMESFGCLSLFNVVMIYLLILWMRQTKNNLYFSHTRQQLASLLSSSPQAEGAHVQVKK